MPLVSIVAPYMRVSLVHIPRRDLVLASSDSLSLRVTVVDSDTPDAAPIVLTGGIGGPGALLAVWADTPGRWCCDYGLPRPACGDVLWAAAGTLADVPGAFDFFLPSGTLASVPPRCGWSVQLTYDTTGSEVLIAGSLHVRQVGAAYLAVTPHLLTDDGIPVHTDTEEHVYG